MVVDSNDGSLDIGGGVLRPLFTPFRLSLDVMLRGEELRPLSLSSPRYSSPGS